MTLTIAKRTPADHDSFPTLQLFVLGMLLHFIHSPAYYLLHPQRVSLMWALLAICRVAEPIALASCFPYAWVMVKDFHMGSDSDASFYAGVFISAFSFAESLTGLFWGCLSDRIGRKQVLLIGCTGTMFSMLIVGFATNFWIALAGRALGGFLSKLRRLGASELKWDS